MQHRYSLQYYTHNSSLDTQLCLVSFLYRHFELRVRQGGCHPILEELVHLLRCASYEPARIQQRVELILDRVKVCVLTHAFDQVVLLSKLFYLVSGFVRQYLKVI